VTISIYYTKNVLNKQADNDVEDNDPEFENLD
jgi:hypothetical protein